MKYFEYGVRTHESERFVGKFGSDPNKMWEGIIDGLSRLGIQGWEIYQVIEKHGVTHFLLQREISKEEAQNMHMKKDEDTYPLGIVDHANPDHNYRYI
ncbi:MAG: hypothetical protein AAB421_04235 [Patescibacteria group bacterium]